jgi:Cu/Ag efflux protein CusF
MRLWKAIALMNLALAVGLLIGYLAWGREAERLRQQTSLSRQALTGEAVEGEWTARGVVRSVLPELNLLVLSHEEIPGFMPSMTMGFRLQHPRLSEGLETGDVIRFTLRGVPPNVLVTGIAKEGKS